MADLEAQVINDWSEMKNTIIFQAPKQQKVLLEMQHIIVTSQQTIFWSESSRTAAASRCVHVRPHPWLDGCRRAQGVCPRVTGRVLASAQGLWKQ